MSAIFASYLVFVVVGYSENIRKKSTLATPYTNKVTNADAHASLVALPSLNILFGQNIHPDETRMMRGEIPHTAEGQQKFLAGT